MRALIDTNVLMDTIFSREPFNKDSDKILDMVCEKKIDGCVSVQSLRDIFYFCKKINNSNNHISIIEKLSFIFEVIDVNGQDSFSALMSDIEDYEDGLLAFSAHRNYIKIIITRNEKDYYDSDLVIINPKEIDKYINTDLEAGSVVIDNTFFSVCDPKQG